VTSGGEGTIPGVALAPISLAVSSRQPLDCTQNVLGVEFKDVFIRRNYILNLAYLATNK